MRKKLLIGSIFVFIVSITFLCIVGVWAYFALNSKEGLSSNYINKYIVERFNDENKYLDIDLKKVKLRFMGDGSTIRVKAQKLLVYNNKKPIAQLDNVNISLSLWKILTGQLPAEKIDIDGGKIIYHDDSETVDVKDKRILVKKVFKSFNVVFESIGDIKELNLFDINAQYSDNSGLVLVYRSGNINLKKKNKVFNSKLLGVLDIETPNKNTIKMGSISASSEFNFKEQNLLDFSISFKGIDNPFDIALNSKYDLSQDVFSADLDLSLLESDTISMFGFSKIKGVDLGSLSLNITTERFDLNNGGLARIIGQVNENSINGSLLSDNKKISFNLFAQDINKKILRKYWIDGVAQNTRDWILKNISGVYDLNSKFELDLKTQKISNHSGTIKLKNATVNYYDGLPLLKLNQATANYKDDKITIKIKEGKLNAGGENLSLIGSVVDIYNLKNDTILDFKTPAKMKSQTILWFLRNKNIDIKLPNDDLALLKADTSGKFHLRFNLTKWYMSRYSYVGKFYNASLNKFNNFKNLKSDKIKIIVDSDKTVVSGNITLNKNLKGKLLYKYNNSKESYKVDYKGGVDSEIISYYVGKDLLKVDDKINIDLKYYENKNKDEKISVKSDLKNDTFEILPLNWKKQSVHKSNLEINIDKKSNGKYDVFTYFKSDGNIPINLDINFGGDKKGLKYFKTNKISYADGNLNIKASRKNDILKTEIFGQNFYSDVIRKSLPYITTGDNSQPYSIEFNMNNIKTFDGNLAKKVWGQIKNNGSSYDLISLRIDMLQPLSRSILLYNKKELKLYSDGLSSAYNLLFGGRPIKGGVIGMIGQADNNGVINGKLTVKDITVLDVPESTRILKLFSVVGILDALQTKSLQFRKISGQFALENGVYTTENISAFGNSIAFSAKGKIDVANQTLDLKGLVLPSYELGSIFKDIPIIGAIISGVDGQGPITQRYTARGTFSDYKVEVDATGLLTLGILRNIFSLLFNEEEDVPLLFEQDFNNNKLN